MKIKLMIVTTMMIAATFMTGFTNKGVFVTNYTHPVDGVEYEFKSGEAVELVQETDWGFTVVKDNVRHQISRSNMIRTTRASQKSRVTTETYMLDKVPGKNIKLLKAGEILQILKYEDKYALFSTEDGTQGYVILNSTELVSETNITHGVTKVGIESANKDLIYSTNKGEYVTIKDFVDDKFLIIDNNGNEFKVSKEHIDITKRIAPEVSRGAVTRGTTRAKSEVATEPVSVGSSEKANKLISVAKSHLGKTYVYGTAGPNTFDCSGFTYDVYRKALGITLNRSSIDQSSNGVVVPKSGLMPGDLVFFKTTSARIGHVGIYIGEGKMIHSSSAQRRVVINDITSGYYNQRFVTARRIY